ncbi:unnamed protein product [Cyprideis torosa]|uniref:Uncharacterized protein n=1 Tax=Cyprideis torosa TaxID=163714 RepID=A0A7R8WG70_9CRUS|nr:unnamed protein product [Cyprideis torosa]CAG0897835.1 unnamed protein product [Cyprideis torosa]
MVDEGNHNAPAIQQRVANLKEKLDRLENLAAARKGRLMDNAAYLQFMWKSDVVESWILDKEAHTRTDDVGRDLSAVLTLLTKQETFDAGLHAFEHEGIQNITALKDQLVDGGHDQSAAILKRHGEVIARWQELLRMSDDRKQNLLKQQEKFREIEDLYLTFAKKASAFNSWFENAEEDMTEPVLCHTVEEIKSIQEQHAAFNDSLTSAQEDFEALAELDRKIKSFNVGPNPYTWFTMEALEDTWKNLKRIIKDRDTELRKEAKRQEENDVLRNEFAAHANAFHSWMNKTRTGMIETSGSLEEQMLVLKEMSTNIRSHYGDLEKIEKLGAILEEHLILDNRYTEHSYDLPILEEGEPDAEFENILDIVDPSRTGSVWMQDYMAFLISKETENVQSAEEINQAFKAIAGEEKPYVTANELHANLSREMADYCIHRMKPYVDPRSGREIPNAFDYQDFTQNLFQKAASTPQHLPTPVSDGALEQNGENGALIEDGVGDEHDGYLVPQ